MNHPTKITVEQEFAEYQNQITKLQQQFAAEREALGAQIKTNVQLRKQLAVARTALQMNAPTCFLIGLAVGWILAKWLGR